MTDRTFTAAELREVLCGEGTAADKVQALHETILFPKRPTLADMTPEERAECRWMQCDYGGVIRDSQSRGVIGYLDHGDKVAVILTTKCGIRRRDYASVTPRPDLPRMEWPGDQKPAPALPGGWRLADHKDDGRVVVTNPIPASDGRVYYVMPNAGDDTGYDWLWCDPAELTYLDQEAATSDTVPESTLAVGSEWHDADALTRACEETGRDQITVTDKDGDVCVWNEFRADWRDLYPIQEYAPFTIIHAGKEDDQ